MGEIFRRKKEVIFFEQNNCNAKCSENNCIFDEIEKNTSEKYPKKITESGNNIGVNYAENDPQKRGNQYECSLCNIEFARKDNYDRHLLSKRHITNSKLNCEELYCNVCNINYSSKKDLKRHFGTNKHQMNIGEIKKPNTFKCEICNISFNKKAILSKHFLSKSHIVKEIAHNKDHGEPTNNGENTKPDTLAYLDVINKMLVENKELRNFFVGQTQELIKVMVEQNTKMIESNKNNVSSVSNNNTSNIIHGNVNNHRFNINFFLNEKCKDAINLPEFIENIEVSHMDLENNAELGFVDGISKIILDNMKQLSVYERPIHCTDTKRETLYVKYDNKWTKEDSEEKLNKAIQNVSYKGIGVLNEWKESNPEYKDINSEFSERCLIMTKNTMAGYNRESFYPKIIKNISKETVLDKTQIE
jgi:hypothetical protein